MPRLKHLVKFLTLAILLLMLEIAMFYGLPTLSFPNYHFVWLAVTTIMLSAHLIVYKGKQKSPSDAPFYFMAAMALRIFLSFATIAAYVYLIGEYKITMVAHFFVLYFAYTFFEIKTLLLSLQPQSKSSTQ